MPLIPFFVWFVRSLGVQLLYVAKIAGVFWLGIAISLLVFGTIQLGVGGSIDLVKARLRVKRVRAS